MRRVVVTGIGVVSSLGHDLASFWSECLAGPQLAVPLPPHWQHYYRATSQRWVPLNLPTFSRRAISKAQQLTLDPVSLIALYAAEEALDHAGFARVQRDRRANTYQITGVDKDRAAVFFGTGLGGARAPFDNYLAHALGSERETLERFADREQKPLFTELAAALNAHARVNPLVICQTMPNAVSANLGIRYGFRGVNDTACFSCASGTAAIGRAFEAIARGEVDLCIAGGAEHLGDRAGGVFMGFDRLQALAHPHADGSPENCPFDNARSGFLFSEGGCAAVVLEAAEHVARRDGQALAEVTSFALNSDANSLVAISAEDNAIVPLLQTVLRRAQLAPQDIGYINAHGTSTRTNDPIEARIIERLFPHGPLVNSSKSILGHTIGASGALEFAVTVMSILDQRVHTSLNLEQPIADLNFVRRPTSHRFDHALTHSFGFGGHNAALVLSKAKD